AKLCPVQLQGLLILERAHPPQPTALLSQEVYCVWTGRSLMLGDYDVDHLIPVATLPINELWNLVPSDPGFNQHVKRARLPSEDWRSDLPQRLEATYHAYGASLELEDALQRGSHLRFAAEQVTTVSRLAEAVTSLVYSVAEARNTPRFGYTR
ncbi:HNH endonuclease domain-containing protein, partial [Deinococcus sp. UYEF24]